MTTIVIFTYLSWVVYFLTMLRFNGKMISVDWSPSSDLFDNGVHIRTVFVRLNDLLKFRCPPGLSLQIHLMKSLEALECRFQSDNSAIGFCSPETTDPRLVIRRFSPMPEQPLFEEGEAYYFAAATNDTFGRLNDGLCRKIGMRLRIFVLPRDAAGSDHPVLDLTRSLWLREQIKRNEKNLGIEETSTTGTTTTTHSVRRIPHIKTPKRDQIHRTQPTRHITAESKTDGLKYDITERKASISEITEFSHLGRLPNPLANHFPQLEFEVGYEDEGVNSSNSLSKFPNLPLSPRQKHSLSP